MSQQTFGFVEPPDDPRVEVIASGAGRVYVGTCGWSYKDWIGPFYPHGTKAADMLPYYAERFPAVEIDATYYRIPSVATFAGMAERTPAAFRFSVKLPGSLTHLPVEDGLGVHDDARVFREALEPLHGSGKLAAVLAQFPYSFHPGAATEAYLGALRGALADLPMVCEFRSREWQRPATLRLLEEIGAGWCNVDEPHFKELLHPSSDVVGPLAYVRFHGRNAKQWWTGDSAERYDYAYAPEELVPWTQRVGEMAAAAPQTLVFFNNHRFGKAVKSAELFAALLSPR
jgi:uncharacterized protein YecE (DUF72 family)